MRGALGRSRTSELNTYALPEWVDVASRPLGLAVIGLSGLAACGGGGGPHATVATRNGGAPNTAIGVNAYLWRATLDTLAFMPLLRPTPTAGW